MFPGKREYTIMSLSQAQGWVLAAMIITYIQAEPSSFLWFDLCSFGIKTIFSLAGLFSWALPCL